MEAAGGLSKVCRTCLLTKPVAQFGRHRFMADGHLNSCKECRAAYEAEWRSKNASRSAALRSRATKKYLATCRGKANRTRLQRKREAVAVRATPLWANHFFIEEIYLLSSERSRALVGGTDWHVDHIVPLQSPLVCGLHTHDNLRVITAFENRSKRNRHWPDMPGIN